MIPHTAAPTCQMFCDIDLGQAVLTGVAVVGITAIALTGVGLIAEGGLAAAGAVAALEGATIAETITVGATAACYAACPGAVVLATEIGAGFGGASPGGSGGAIAAAEKTEGLAPSSGAAAVAARVIDDVAGASRVNPLGGANNCVNCVVAGDATLSGHPAVALDSAVAQPISRLETTFGGRFQGVSGQAEIEGMLASAGSGSRGIVFGSRGREYPGHVFKAANQGGSIRFVDFQSGRGASFEGFESFSFLWTNR